jgi:hypothetical protein
MRRRKTAPQVLLVHAGGFDDEPFAHAEDLARLLDDLDAERPDATAELLAPFLERAGA